MDPPESSRLSTASFLKKPATTPNLDNDDTCAEGSILSHSSSGTTRTAVAVSPVSQNQTKTPPKKLTPAEQWARIKPGSGPKIVPKRSASITDKNNNSAKTVSSTIAVNLSEKKEGKASTSSKPINSTTPPSTIPSMSNSTLLTRKIESKIRKSSCEVKLTLHDPTEFKPGKQNDSTTNSEKTIKSLHLTDEIVKDVKTKLSKMNNELRKSRSSTEIRTGREKKELKDKPKKEIKANKAKLTGDMVWNELVKAWKQQENEKMSNLPKTPKSILKK